MRAAKEEFYSTKKTINISDIDVNNIVISKLIQTKNNFKYLIGYLDEIIKLLVLVLPKVTVCFKTFKGNNNKLICLRIDDGKLKEKYKAIWTRIAGVKSIKLNLRWCCAQDFVELQIAVTTTEFELRNSRQSKFQI